MKKWAILIMGLMLIGSQVLADRQWEAVSHAVDDYSHTLLPDLEYCWAFQEGWSDGMNYISYDQIAESYDDDVIAKYWTDYSLETWGQDNNDPNGTDFADSAGFCGHGDSGYNPSPAGCSTYVMGANPNPPGVLSVRTDDYSIYERNMEFGSTSSSGHELNGLFSHSCEGMQYEAYYYGAYTHLNDGAPDGDGIYSFKIYGGKHGASSGGAEMDDDAYDHVTGAHWNDIGDLWVDIYTIIYPRLNDRCGTVLVYGESNSTRILFYNNAGFKDYDDVGDYNGMTYFGVSGCDPSNGQALPTLPY